MNPIYGRELPHEMLFETFIFSDEERMNPAKQRSANGTFMWGEERKQEKVNGDSERGGGGRGEEGRDKSAPKAIWK